MTCWRVSLFGLFKTLCTQCTSCMNDHKSSMWLQFGRGEGTRAGKRHSGWIPAVLQLMHSRRYWWNLEDFSSHRFFVCLFVYFFNFLFAAVNLFAGVDVLALKPSQKTAWLVQGLYLAPQWRNSRGYWNSFCELMCGVWTCTPVLLERQ